MHTHTSRKTTLQKNVTSVLLLLKPKHTQESRVELATLVMGKDEVPWRGPVCVTI